MTIFFPGKRLSLALSVLLLTGCAQFNSDKDSDSGRYEDPYAQIDFDGLLGFDANMAQMPAASRAEVCTLLLKRQKDSPGPGIQLRLMMARLFSDACGTIPGILEDVGFIPPGSLSDERVQKLVAIHTEALKRLKAASRQPAPLECKQKTVRSAHGSKNATGSKNTTGSKNVTGSKNDENRLLREKLEAIRSMEKHLDESGDIK